MAKSYVNGQIFLSVENPLVNLRYDVKGDQWTVYIATLSEGNYTTLCFEESYTKRPDINIEKVREINGDCVHFTGYYEITVKPSDVEEPWFEGDNRCF